VIFRGITAAASLKHFDPDEPPPELHGIFRGITAAASLKPCGAPPALSLP